MHFVTDGHVFDIMLTRDPQDRWSPPGDFVMSENVLSGRGFLELTGHAVPDAILDDTPLIQMMGRYMGRLINAIKTQSIDKLYEGWSALEKAAAADTALWILGGSLATRPPAASLLIASATDWLSAHGIATPLYPISNSETAALLGVVYASDLA
jgi:hypothetical protein